MDTNLDHYAVVSVRNSDGCLYNTDDFKSNLSYIRNGKVQIQRRVPEGSLLQRGLAGGQLVHLLPALASQRLQLSSLYQCMKAFYWLCNSEFKFCL